MEYTLVMPNGRRMQFYLRSVAEMYQSFHGGFILSNDGRPALKLVA
jgi:hypothetical protein